MSLTMYDAIPANVGHLPSASFYAGYVDGAYQSYPLIKAKFPKAKVLSISVFSSDNAECLDVESGDATIADIYAWFKRQLASNVWRPVIYSSVSNMDHIVATMTANGFSRDQYRLWSAHYGAGQHICGPDTCKLTSTAMDGTQWQSTAFWDESELNNDFFGGNVAEGPYRHEVPKGNSWSLEGIANERHTPVAHIIDLTRQHLDSRNLSVFNAYVALMWALQTARLPVQAMPEGLVYYTVNP